MQVDNVLVSQLVQTDSRLTFQITAGNNCESLLIEDNTKLTPLSQETESAICYLLSKTCQISGFYDSLAQYIVHISHTILPVIQVTDKTRINV